MHSPSRYSVSSNFFFPKKGARDVLGSVYQAGFITVTSTDNVKYRNQKISLTK